MKEFMGAGLEGFERSRQVLCLFSIVLTIGVLSPRALHARQVYFGSETESVTVTYGAPTLFRFPSEVKTISQAQKFKIEPANSEQPNYALLSVTPRFTTGSSDVAFILGDGTVIKVRIRISAQAIPEKTDSIFDFKSKESLIDSGEGKPGGAALSEFELMRAMLRGDQVVGYDIKNVIRRLSPGFKGTKTTLLRIYTGGNLNGYIFEIVNTTRSQRLFINNENLMLGDPSVAILSSVDQAVIEPEGSGKEKTYLRIVAKPTSVYNQLVLPVQVVEKK